MVIFAVALLALVTVKVLSVRPPTLGVVAPLKKLAPVKTTSSVCPRTLEAGLMLLSVGTGLFTVKFWPVEVPPPGALLVMEKLRTPVAAFAVIIIFAVKLVELFTVCALMIIPAPRLSALTPLIKLAPVKTTSSVCSRLPMLGAMLVSVGAGLFTVKTTSFEVSPFGLVTEKLRAPVSAVAAMVRSAVKLVALVTVTLFFVMPVPTLTVAPATKPVPVKTTFKRCKRLPLIGAMLVTDKLVTVNVSAFEVPPPRPGLVTEKLRGPGDAAAVIVRFAVNEVEELTMTEFTFIPAAPGFTVVDGMKFVPVKTTSRVFPTAPDKGLIEVKVGSGLASVIKVPSKPFVVPTTLVATIL